MGPLAQGLYWAHPETCLGTLFMLEHKKTRHFVGKIVELLNKKKKSYNVLCNLTF